MAKDMRSSPMEHFTRGLTLTANLKDTGRTLGKMGKLIKANGLMV